MVICAVGVFIPVAVLIVAPSAIEVGSKMHVSKLALLVALSGGGKAGNIISRILTPSLRLPASTSSLPQ